MAGYRYTREPCGSNQLCKNNGTAISTAKSLAWKRSLILNGWITKEDVLKVYEILKKNQYGQYLKDVLDGKYLDVLH